MIVEPNDIEKKTLTQWIRLLEMSFREEVKFSDISFRFNTNTGIGTAITATYKNISIDLTDYDSW